MSRKKKSKTKKQLKQSVDNLYEALMKEKEKHRKASKMIGEMKQVINFTSEMADGLMKTNTIQTKAHDPLENDYAFALDVAAEFLRRVTKEY